MHHGVRGQSPHTHTSPSPRSKAPLLFSDPFLSPLQPLPLHPVSLTSFTSFTSFASLFQTPFVAASQINLCNCSPSRTGKPSARIHSASARGSRPGHFLSGSSNTGENKTCLTRRASPCCAAKSRANS